MDAQAILLKLGWSGPGNPLNPNARPGATSGLGLTRPILVARRKGNSGVGNKTTKDPTNQWWLRGFEDALKGVGEERRTPADARTPNALTSELYRFFVRGEVVAGTLGDKHNDDGEGANGKRKREGDDEGDDDDDDDDKNGKKRKGKKKETREERKARKEERKKRKEERRVKREEKKKRKEEREARRADRKLRREKKAAAKLLKRRKEGEEDAPRPQYEDYSTPPMTEQKQEQTDEPEVGVKVKKTKEKKDRKDKKNKEEKKTPKESKKRKTREEASTDEAPKKSKKSQAAE
ncbi:uncharacterized protein BO66DRAFT_429832 [Aspergillus aculeatinus CBS 121060]|uniref:Uncharacterized protein n=1 Tax=Aspergillus aculeatinus CBS 121060 TaxID=1448322 RepID=A0ACD1H5D2_9EURO|nr:hypothetical protein BO66DRAFT_429832 [Aspergillus aculeatinus CBS 121060]RAH68665.1 hypothetical protein BO66DRAFT_429832 [Aspergillus aculeatinus CBS 121060]